MGVGQEAKVVKMAKEGAEQYKLVGEGEKFVTWETVTKLDSISVRKRKLGIETETMSSSTSSTSSRHHARAQ